ncbi:hypothetical protein B296_00031930 [Ensete ventricosum]|uniref:Uncharacterized protein n=1 Tax=Ensete ventricosum TaxID=4639 RepID=A0A426Y4M1_ENSVE|nr:hypothetical protein B296_00031930 [Ensete ventricosum]
MATPNFVLTSVFSVAATKAPSRVNSVALCYAKWKVRDSSGAEEALVAGAGATEVAKQPPPIKRPAERCAKVQIHCCGFPFFWDLSGDGCRYAWSGSVVSLSL